MDSFLLLVGSVIFVVIVKFMCHVFGPDDIFFSVLLLCALLGYSQAKLCALLSPNSQTAFVYYALLMSFEMILSGFLIFPENAPIYLKWTIDIMFTRWAVYALLFNQFNNFKDDGNLLEGILNNQGELVLQFYGISSYDVARSILFLVFFLVVFEVLVMLALFPGRDRLVKLSSLTEATHLWDLNDTSPPLSVTSQSLQIDLISTDTISSKSIVERFSLSTVFTHFPPSLVEPYDKMTISSNQTTFQSDGRVVFRQTYTETRDSCRVSDVLDLHSRAEFLFRRINYSFHKGGDDIRLLHGISGLVSSGELCAIMGSSGAGI